MKQLNQIKNKRQAQYYLNTRHDILDEMFVEQYPDLPTGGFYLPRVRNFNDGTIEFSCHYYGYDNEEDSWTWFLNIDTGEFSN